MKQNKTIATLISQGRNIYILEQETEKARRAEKEKKWVDDWLDLLKQAKSYLHPGLMDALVIPSEVIESHRLAPKDIFKAEFVFDIENLAPITLRFEKQEDRIRFCYRVPRVEMVTNRSSAWVRNSALHGKLIWLYTVQGYGYKESNSMETYLIREAFFDAASKFVQMKKWQAEEDLKEAERQRKQQEPVYSPLDGSEPLPQLVG
jgi:hypothetical protein